MRGRARGKEWRVGGKMKLMELRIPEEFTKILERSPSVVYSGSTEELFAMATGDNAPEFLEVKYILPSGKCVTEATVARLRNGIAVNYPEPYMRRREPDCMYIGDDLPTDKPRYKEHFSRDFDATRSETLEWLAGQKLAAFFFKTGRSNLGADAMAIVPANAAFFALGLAMLQGILPVDRLPDGFRPTVFLVVAPPFRHTHFEGKQVVVHNRVNGGHEIFSYNLYPGPSAKKGIYGTLIQKGANEGWITAHCSAVRVITPYDNIATIMHEGASGGGKSEMLEQPHRLPDGRLLKGRNIITKEERYIEIPRTCDLHPVCDDMALCHPSIQKNDGKLSVIDAESGWFLRVNHITEYGTDPDLEKLTAKPPTPLVFLNIDAVPGSRGLIWEHIEDTPGKACPNPRVIIPRSVIPHVVDDAVSVDIRSIGVRMPPCTKKKPTYGIAGIFHVLPPSLAWLWRLVVPRGHENPSIVSTTGMSSEGVGSYWPFATGTMVEQANLLLTQIEKTPHTRYIITPNQHIGAWKTGFMPQWLARDYLARRGHAKFRREQVQPSRCPLLGYALTSMRIEGLSVANWFLQVDTQPEVGPEAYDRGAEILREFFLTELKQYEVPALAKKGREIIDCFVQNGTVEDYCALLPGIEDTIEFE